MIIDDSFNVWTISPGNTVLKNGKAAGFTANVASLSFVEGAVWQMNTSNQWYQWNVATSAWVPGIDPLPTPTPKPTATPTATPTPTPSPTATAAPAVTFNPATTQLQLSTDKLTATCGSGTRSVALTTVGKSAGKWYWNFKAVTGGPNLSVGLANSSLNIPVNFLGVDANAIGFYSFDPTIPLTYWLNNQILLGPTVAAAPDVNGATYRLAWDAGGKLLWLQSPSMMTAIGPAAWNDNPNADPATGVGGLDVSALGGGELWPAVALGDNGTVVQLIVAGLTNAPKGFSLLS